MTTHGALPPAAEVPTIAGTQAGSRMVYGQFQGSTAAINIAGSGGWTVVRNSIGNWTVTLTNGFTSNLSFVIMATASSVDSLMVAQPVSATTFVVLAYNQAGAAIDVIANFLAIGT